MNGNVTRFIPFSAGLVGLVILAWVLAGQAAKPAPHGIHLPTDWSHHHLIFSQPGTAQQRAQVEGDPRYWQQLHRRSQRMMLPAYASENPGSNIFEHSSVAKPPKKLHRDWAENLGAGAKVGAGNFPAKFSFDSTVANCATDYVVFSTGLAGTSGQANLVAFNNLYSGCGGTVPSIYWAYNITDIAIGSGQILTSPVPSLDGSQLAFVEDNGSSATLILLKWAASTTDTVTLPETPALETLPLYRACTAPCMTTIDLRSGLHTATRDTTSSVFYDYTNDIAWVGDSFGWLHQFTGVFKGLPAEVTSGGFPVQMPAQLPLSSPVYDRISASVFVGDGGGFLNRVDATTAAVTQSGQLDFGVGVVDVPMVDVTRGQVYVFASDDGSGACIGGADCTAVYQLSATFVPNDTGTEALVGTATFFGAPTPSPLYAGGFDSTYMNSTNATGNLYVCGNTGGNPILYSVPIQAGILGSLPATINTLATTGSTPACSPVTDVFSPGATPGSAATERLFFSVQGNSTAAACGGGGCIQNFINTPWQASASFTLGQQILVKTSNPAVDFINVVSTAGTTGFTPPIWPNTPGMTRADGTVFWIAQGNPATALNGWVANHAYNFVGGRILDSGGNVEIVRVKGTSGLTTPVWATTLASPTVDGTVIWINAGPPPTSALKVAGGTSGIVIDNTVGPGPLGTSQVYFSTLSDQACGTSGTGGCAVQASQPALQ